MDAFEAARLKHAKNKERKERSLNAVGVDGAKITLEEEVVFIEPVAPLVPKEKAKRDAVIEVRISFPTKELAFAFKKKNVISNLHPSQMNETVFRSALRKSLEQILGAVDDIPISGN